MTKVEQHDAPSRSGGRVMDLTDRARRDLDRYLERVRESVRNREGVDPEDVVAGVREYVEATFASREGAPVTAEDLADVLERLGSPEEWAEEETESPILAPSDPVPRGGLDADPWIELAPLILAAAGGILILVELTVPLGWALLASRPSPPDSSWARPPTKTGRRPMSATLVALLWRLSAIAAVVCILLAPAVLIWGQSQIGGALVPFLLEHTLPLGEAP